MIIEENAMLELVEQETRTASRYFGPAKVVCINQDEGVARVRFEETVDETEVWARIAIPAIQDLRRGGQVLVAGQGVADYYIIGVLGANAPTTPDRSSLTLACGVLPLC